MLNGMRVISKRPFVFLYILFLLTVGLTAGIVTQINLNYGAYALTQFHAGTILLPLIISLLKNALLFCSCVLLAIWLPGALLHAVIAVLKGFLIGFTVAAFFRNSFWIGVGYSLICVIIPDCFSLYGFFKLSAISFGEWRMRFKNYFVSKSLMPVSNEYSGLMRPCIYVFLLSAVAEGVLAPIIIGMF